MHRRKSVGNRLESLETDVCHWKPTCLVGDPRETNTPYLRPMDERTEHRYSARPTFFITNGKFRDKNEFLQKLTDAPIAKPFSVCKTR